jgi:hypothetical protein
MDNDDFEQETFWATFSKIGKYWLWRPFTMGMLFGLGHFLSLRVLGPHILPRLALDQAKF